MPEHHFQIAQDSTDGKRFAGEEIEAIEGAQLRALVDRNLNGLPAMPSNALRMNRFLSATPVVLSDLCEVIGGDLSIAAQMMRLAARKFGVDACSSAIEENVVLLGIRCLRNLAKTIPVLASDEAVMDELNALWQHSRATAMLSERIACEYGCAQPARAYVAGLLHDLGKVPLILCSRDHETRGVVESEHCRLGAALARKWSLPPYLLEVIQHHHHPAIADRESLLVAIVAAANEFAHRCCEGMPLSLRDRSVAVRCDRVFKSELDATLRLYKQAGGTQAMPLTNERTL